MALVGYSSHFFDDANNPIRLQESSAIRPSVIREPTNRTQPPEDQKNGELKRLLSIPRLDIRSFSMDNRAHEQSVPIDLRRRVPIELIQTENMMEYPVGPARQYASNKPFSVHGDFLSKCSQVSKILEDLFEDIAGDLDLRTSTGDHFSKKEYFGRINTQNVDEFRGLNAKIRDKVLPIEDNKHDTSDARKQRIAKFTLPPDYDPNNAKWTLKYRYSGPNLTELLPYSGIYVNVTNLKHCNELAMDCKSLARLLMVEVFSESALKVCSLTGARARCFRGTKTDPRPGLDKDARAILVRYVEIYGEKQGWCTEDHKPIINAMRNKLNSLRRKDRHRV